MDEEEFNEFLVNELEQLRKKLAIKGQEYAPEADQLSRFHNFETAAALNGESIEKALWGFVTKHLVSLSDMIKHDVTDYPYSVWEEKISDVTIYMLLLKAMVVYDFDIQRLVLESFEKEQKVGTTTIINNAHPVQPPHKL